MMPTVNKQQKVTSTSGRFVIVELIISVSLSGVLIVICHFWIHGKNPNTESEPRKQYCIPCRSISLNVDEDIENFRDLSFQQGEYLQCCAHENKTPKIVDLSVERQRRKQISSGSISGVPPLCAVLDHQTVSQGSAKVVGFTKSTIGGELCGNTKIETMLYQDTVMNLFPWRIRDASGGVQRRSAYLTAPNLCLPFVTGYNAPNSYLAILNWDKESSQSFVGSDVEYRNGSLVIGRSAYYTVYSQITFNQSRQRDDDDEFKTFAHLVYKHINDTDHKYDLKLLESSKSLCQSKIRDCTGASHISSVFFFRKSDEITVRVNDPRRVVSTPLGNFFGIFPVS